MWDGWGGVGGGGGGGGGAGAVKGSSLAPSGLLPGLHWRSMCVVRMVEGGVAIWLDKSELQMRRG